MELREKPLAVLHLSEPPLEFGYRQKTEHPKDGLFLYGPHNSPEKPPRVRIGVVGTAAGISYFCEWSARIKKLVEVPPPTAREKKDRLHLANFPGIEEALRMSFIVDQFVTYALSMKDIDGATRILNHHEAVKKTVQLYVQKVKGHIANDERDVDIWVFVLPEAIYERCRPEAKRKGLPMVKGDFGRRQSERANLPLLGEVIDQSGEEIFDDAPDFHRQIKAAFLKIGKTTQILRETTIAPDAFLNAKGNPVRRTQDSATIAWNLATGLYYKTQPLPPWRLAATRSGVCYIGLVYKLIPNHPRDFACCAAQMFLYEGDGVVFRGANGPWQTDEHEYHLKPWAAKDLIRKVLETYASRYDSPPKELFIHGKTNFHEDEWKAFVDAAPAETNVVGVRIKTTAGENKLFRDGDYPVLRGTALILDNNNAYLWTTGYVPQLDTYIGPETPNPLFITTLRSKGEMPDIKVVLEDIMGLTKINYNSCNFNDGQPVTVRFANMVGNILVMGSARGADKQPFKFYV